MFVAGIYYRHVPEAAAGWLPRLHAALHVFGGIAFPGSLALMLVYGQAFEPGVIVTSTIVYAAIALFAIVVFRSTAAGRQRVITPGTRRL